MSFHTHIRQQLQTLLAQPVTDEAAHLDQLLATWEWRSGATHWLVMKARTRIPA